MKEKKQIVFEKIKDSPCDCMLHATATQSTNTCITAYYIFEISFYSFERSIFA